MRAIVVAALMLPIAIASFAALVTTVNVENLPTGSAPMGWSANRW